MTFIASGVAPLSSQVTPKRVQRNDCSAPRFVWSALKNAFLSADQTNLGALQSFRCTRFGVTCDDNGATPDAMNVIGPKASCHANTTTPYVAGVQPMIDFVKGLKDDTAQIM